MAKEAKKKWRLWLIRIIIFLLIPSILILVLYLTDNLDIFISRTKEELSNISVFSIVLLIILFIGDIFKGWASNYISDLIFPGEIKVIKNTVDKVSKTTDDILQNVTIDPRIIKKYMDDLSSCPSIVKKENQIQKWYDDFEINPTLKEILILFVKQKQETVIALQETIKSEGHSDFSKALENLKVCLEKGDTDQIKSNYFQFTKQPKKENIELLKRSIIASKQLFAFNHTLDLYNELIKVEPTDQNHFDFGLYLQKLNYVDEAILHYKEALKIRRELAKEDPHTYLPVLATTLNNLAILQADRNDFPQALEKHEEALKIRKELAGKDPKTYLPDLAMTLNNLANLHWAKKEFQQALEKHEEALHINRELAKQDPGTYLPDLATTLNNFAVLHMARDEFSKALEKYNEALKIRRELAKNNPRAYMPDLATTLYNLGNLYSDLNEVSQAIEKYGEALKIYRELATENPRAYSPGLAITLNNLANIEKARNEISKATEKYDEALKTYRELAEVNPDTYLPYVLMVLKNLLFYTEIQTNFNRPWENTMKH